MLATLVRLSAAPLHAATQQALHDAAWERISPVHGVRLPLAQEANVQPNHVHALILMAPALVDIAALKHLRHAGLSPRLGGKSDVGLGDLVRICLPDSPLRSAYLVGVAQRMASSAASSAPNCSAWSFEEMASNSASALLCSITVSTLFWSSRDLTTATSWRVSMHLTLLLVPHLSALPNTPAKPTLWYNQRKRARAYQWTAS